MSSLAATDTGFLRDSRNVATTLRFLVLAAAAVLGLSSPLREPTASKFSGQETDEQHGQGTDHCRYDPEREQRVAEQRSLERERYE